MELKDFKKFIRGKSVHKLLHRARKSSLERILASEKDFGTSSRKAAAATSKPKLLHLLSDLDHYFRFLIDCRALKKKVAVAFLAI